MPTIADAKPRRPMRRGDPRLTERELGEPPPAPAQGRTYGYTRVSTDMQADHGQSLDVQRDQLAGWALGAFAEFERDCISTRIRESKQRQKANGEYLGGPPPFGWSHDAERQLVPVPVQQAAIRRIRKLAAEGLSPYKISADLAERGVKLSHVTVRKIIAGRKAAA